MTSLLEHGPLISPHDYWTLAAMILLGAAVSIYLEQTYAWAAKVSGPVIALVGGMLLSNLRIAPAQSPLYEVVEGYLVPVAIPLLLFRANVVRIVKTTGPLFVAVHLAAIGTIVGALVAAVLFRGMLEAVPELAAIMTASYVGGAVNFLAVKGWYQVSENLTGPLMVADNIIMAGGFILLLLIANAAFFRRHFPHPHSLEAESGTGPAAESHWRPKQVSLRDIAWALALAVLIAATAVKLAALIEKRVPLPPTVASVAGNKFLMITFLSVVVATCFHRRVERIAGAEELGACLLYIFFFENGLRDRGGRGGPEVVVVRRL